MSAWGSSPGFEAANGAAYPSKTGVHTDGSNFLLCDGHVKWLHGASVSSGYNNFAGGSDPGATSCPNAGYCVAAAVDYNGNGPTGAPFAATFSYD